MELARKHRDVLVIIGVIIYFAIRLVYFACHIHPEIPPDETTHYGKSVAFSKVLFIPENGPDNYEFGLMTNRPYLYYWLMGKCLHLNFFSINDLVFLRLINGLIGIICAIFVYKWTKLVTANKFIRFLTVVLFTNILMATGLFASVNYDNLTNLFAVMSFYYLTIFYKRGNVEISAMFFISVFAGCLCKNAFLPLAVMLVIAFATKCFINFRNLKKREQTRLSSPFGIQAVMLSLAAIVLFVLNCILFGGNMVNYGVIEPKAHQVVGVDNAMKNRIFARNYICKQYKEGNYTLDHAVAMTEIIKNKGDRTAALILLRNARDYDKIRGQLMNFVQFTPVWFRTMLGNAVGYMGHQSLIKPNWYRYPYYWVLVIPTFFFLRKIHLKEADGIFLVAFVTVLLYSLVLWQVNYKIYIKSALFGLAMAGRYFFPVLLPICGLISYYTLNFLSTKEQLFLTIIVSAWFIYGDFIYFLQVVPDYWLVHNWPI